MPLAGLCFRLARADDYPALHRLCYPQYAAADFARQYERSLQRQAAGRGYHLVAILEPVAAELVAAASPAGSLVGSGQLILHPHSAELAELSVPVAHRGRGIGTALIKVLIAIARHLAVANLEIGVLADNQRAMALYRRLGFVADRPLRVALTAEPALILVKDLHQKE